MQELSGKKSDKKENLGGWRWQGPRLKQVIADKFNGNASALARICEQIDGQSSRSHGQRLSSYLAQKSIPGFDAACVIAQAAGVSLDWLAGGPETMGTADDKGHVAIPIAAVSASAGNGADMFASQEFEDHVIYSRDLLRREVGNGRRLAFISVSGASMEPTLRPGDRMLVAENAGAPIIDGAIYVLRHRYAGIVVKRLYIHSDGTMQIRGDNETTPIGVIDPQDEDVEWTIIAHVLRLERPL